MNDAASADWYRGFFSGAWLAVQAALKGDHDATVRESEWLIEQLGLQDGGRVIDVPCGTGRHAIELAPGAYVYSCPLIPTPNYRLIVED